MNPIRMKTENLPIKLECFCLLASSRRELIGFIMIPIRGIQIVFGSRLGKVIRLYLYGLIILIV